MSKQGDSEAERERFHSRDSGGSSARYSGPTASAPPGGSGGPGGPDSFGGDSTGMYAAHTWSPRSGGGNSGGGSGNRTFNPRSRFNPNRTFNVARGGSGGHGGGQGNNGAGSPNQGSASEPGTQKRFNPRSMFSPTSGGVPGSSGNGRRGGGAATPSGPPAVTSSGEPLAWYSDLPTAPSVGHVAELGAMYRPPMHPLQYHLYAPSPFRVRPALEAHQRLPEDLFISNDLRDELLQRNEATLQVLPASSLPEFVHVYHSLVPLDTQVASRDRFGFPVWRYKAVSNTDGRTYCLMRIEGFHLTQERAMAKIKMWERVASAALVGVVEAFTTLAFGDHSVVIVHEYFPLAQTLAEKYSGPSGGIPEGLLWSLASQLIMAIQAAHKARLAVRTVDAKSILVTQKGRVRIGSLGALDLLDFQDSAAASNNYASTIGHGPNDSTYVPSLPGTPARSSSAPASAVEPGTPNQVGTNGSSGNSLAGGDRTLDYRMKDDWNRLGAVLQGLTGPKHKYSGDLTAFIKTLSGDDVVPDEFLPVISKHMWRVLDGSLALTDTLEETLATELENARLVRLLAKLEVVLDRPENIDNPRWAPTGDRYMLRLLRDYIFHQVDEQGAPALDLAHILAALNKLDAGIDENVLLLSSDEQTRIIVSYQDLKTAVDQAFRELQPRSA